MRVSDMFSVDRDMCNVCGQTPCNCTHITESAYSDGVSDGMRGEPNRRASSIYGPESGEYQRGYNDGVRRGKEEQEKRIAQGAMDRAPYEEMGDEELINLRRQIQKRTRERQAIYTKLRGADYSFDFKRHTPPNHNELKQQGEQDNKAWHIINGVLQSRGINIDRLGEGVADGNNVGDTIRSLYQKIYDQGDDALEYLNTSAPLFSMFWEQYEGDLDSIIAEVSPKNLIRIAKELQSVVAQEGVAEGAEFGAYYSEKVAQEIFNKRQDITSEDEVLNQAYHIVSNDLGQRTARYKFNYDEDFPSDVISNYFHLQKQGVAEESDKQFAQRMKKQAEQPPTMGMSNAEKVDKGWRNPNIPSEQIYKVVALTKSNALAKPTKMKVKADSIEDLFARLSANDWYPLEINGVEVIAGKRLKQGVAEMDSQKPTGRYKADGTRSHSSYGSRDNYNLGDPETTLGPDSIAKPKDVVKKGADALTRAMRGAHPDYSKHEKKLISKMSNAEKVAKGWRNPNMEEGETTRTSTGLVHRATDKYGAGDEPFNPHNPGKYVRDLDSVNKQQVKDLDASMGINWKSHGPKGIEIDEVSDETLTSYLTKVDADSQKHEKDPTKRSPDKRNRSVAGFARAFNKLDARKEQGAADRLVDSFTQELNELTGIKLSEDQEIQRLLHYARAHYPNSKDDQEAFMKYVFHALQHSEEDDMNQDKQIGWLKHEIDVVKNQPAEQLGDSKLDELNFFKTAPAAPKKFVSRVGTLPGQQDLTYRKGGETFTLHQAGESFQLLSNGQVVQTFNAPERDVQAHLSKEGYFLVKAPMTPTKTSSLGGPNWYREGATEDEEADYGNEYQDMVKRMAKKAADQELHKGPVDIGDLARKLRSLGQEKPGQD